ncbi:ATP-binding protein [Paraoerskovia marina]|uniref:ATP-binding protein n=1 Tax=Paraoerskovia marina TaxID=545619 RepID=UPI0009F60F66|nr:ATP-binding protein [Paraoerskovia marina]
MAPKNPFKPTAGARPPVLAGRQDDLDLIDESLDSGPGAPGRLALVTGARGVGKTAMLAAIADLVATKAQWVTITETAHPGLTERLRETALRRDAATTHDPDVGRITGITLPGNIGLHREAPRQPAETMRTALVRLLDTLDRYDTGLIATIDEVQGGRLGELREVAATFQHLTGGGRNHALILAGLPSAVSDVLNDSVLTFLRRAEPITLSAVSPDDVRAALADPIEASGRAIDADALELAVEATGGYPYLIQLVGYQVWRRARD